MENNLGHVVLVKDINPGVSNYGFANGSYISELTEFEDRLYFTANNEVNGTELWVSDGTTEGTQLLIDINSGISNYGYGYSSYVSSFTEFQDQLFFTSNDGEHNNELWVSDGTTEGTQLLLDINSDTSNYGYVLGSYASNFIEFQDQLFFTANDGEHSNELWVSDGTVEGTQLLIDINPGSNNSDATVEDELAESIVLRDPSGSYAANFTEFQDQLFFTADDGENGNELWVSDGTAEGTQLLKDINSGTDNYGFAYSSHASNFVEFQDQLFFTADDGKNGNELWVSDGTAGGTQLVADINPGSSNDVDGSFAHNFIEFQDQLFFTADDGENGNELWISDGTTEGTHLLKDINPSTKKDLHPRDIKFSTSLPSNSGQGSYASNFIEFQDQLFFTANDGEHGNELWVSDGTTEGTQLLKDINPGSSNYGFANGSYPGNFIEFQDQLYFAADDGENGSELWVSDGTAEGTKLVADINPGIDNFDYANGSHPFNFTVFNDELFFSATDHATGNELFKLTFEDLSSEVVTGTNDADRLLGGDRDDRLEGLESKDTLEGGDSNNTLIGNDGQDVFVLESGQKEVLITDFELGRDRLGLGVDLTFADLTFVGNDINIGTELLATLEGVETAELTSEDFTFI